MNKGDLVKVVKKLDVPVILGTLGIIVEKQMGIWGGCDHRVYFSCLNGTVWVYNDEIELVKND